MEGKVNKKQKTYFKYCHAKDNSDGIPIEVAVVLLWFLK
jgi:hypothetical protein